MPIVCDFTKLGTTTIKAGTTWFRIHNRAYGSVAFNDTMVGNARFSPIQNATATVIPTIYAGEDSATAVMETVLHDVPTPSHGFIYVPASPEERVLSTVVVSADLKLANLTVLGLKRVGLVGSQVVDGDKTTYPSTRAFAEALHAACPDIQGTVWDSRQTKKMAFMLFGDRLVPGALKSHFSPLVPVDDDAVQAVLYDLLEQLGASAI